jgi:hypothetical protein
MEFILVIVLLIIKLVLQFWIDFSTWFILFQPTVERKIPLQVLSS